LTADRLRCTISLNGANYVYGNRARDLYNLSQSLSATERLRLASLILNDIVPALTIDEDDAWSEQDLHDLSAFALPYALSAPNAEGTSG
jgi:hypothetical protein